MNGRTEVTERRQAPDGPRRGTTAPRRAAPGPRRPATGARPATARPAALRPPAAPPVPRTGRQGAPAGVARPLPRPRPAPESRTRFVFLVVGLLGGGLLCLLVINTILATGAFRITALQQGNVSLAERVQSRQAQVAAEESPAALAQRAAALGMVIQPRLRFLNLTTGRLDSQPAQMPGIPTVPGYTP